MGEKTELALWGTLILCGALACKGGDKSGASSGSAPASGAGDEKPLVVKADDLYADYHRNEVAADEKYKGKRLHVVAQIQSIDKDAFDNIVLHLKAEGALLGVMAHTQDSEKSKVVKLNKGDMIGVECKGNGMVIGTPSLGDCTILPIGDAKPAASKK